MDTNSPRLNEQNVTYSAIPFQNVAEMCARVDFIALRHVVNLSQSQDWTHTVIPSTGDYAGPYIPLSKSEAHEVARLANLDASLTGITFEVVALSQIKKSKK